MQTLNPNDHSASRPASDEIDLIELCAKIWRGKWKIIGAVLICIALGVAYLLIVPKTYRLEAVLAAPLASDLEPIQPPEASGRYTLPTISSGHAFELVKGYLRSEKKRLDFWKQFHDFEPQLELEGDKLAAFLRFNEELSLTESKEAGTTLSFIGLTPQADVQMLELFLKTVNAQVVDEIVNRMVQILAIQKSKLRDDISRLREQYRVSLQDQIVALEEALTIAQEIGIKETPYEQLANIEVTVVDKQFLLGTTTLSSQLNALKARQDKDTFVPGLRDLQKQLQRVEADMGILERHKGDARTFVILRPLAIPQKEESPKKALVLTLSAVLGGCLGLVWILISGLTQAIRERESQ